MAGQVSEYALSLSNLLDPDVLANPYPLYQLLREEDPVHWDPYLHAWIVTRYEDVITVLTNFPPTERLRLSFSRALARLK